MFALLVLAAVVGVALLAPVIAPEGYDQQSLAGRLLPPAPHTPSAPTTWGGTSWPAWPTAHVSHDLAVVSHMCSRIAVMNRGRIVEELSAAQLDAGAAHDPYTQELLAASQGYDRALAGQLEE